MHVQLTKFTHACVRLDKDDAALVIDPGTFSEDAALDGASGVLITHEHADHLDVAKLRARPELPIWTNEAVAAALGDVAGDRTTVVGDADVFEVAGFRVSVHGEWHELIHRDIPLVSDIGFLVDDTVYYAGDAYTIPPRTPRVLMAPIAAPWLRMAEAVDFVREVRPGLALGTHDAVLSPIGLATVERNLDRLLGSADIEFRRVEPGTTIDL